MNVRLTLGALATAAAVLALAPTAMAGQYHVYSCRDPHTGAVVGADGWTGTAIGFAEEAQACGMNGGGSIYAHLSGTISNNYGDEGKWVFSAPSATTINHFSLWRYAFAGTGQVNGTPGTSITTGGAGVGSCFQPSCSSKGYQGIPLSSSNLVTASGLSTTDITAAAMCGGSSGGTCPADSTTYSADLEIYSADIVLEDDLVPSASTASGQLVSGATQRGASSVQFTASAPAAGVYSAVFSIDGTPASSPIIDTNGGRCQDIGDSGDGRRAFGYVTPCKPSVNADVSFDTSNVADGTHTLGITVTDAAGNSAPVYTGTLITHNAPVQNGLPTASGSTVVGQTVNGTDTTFSAPSGAGATTLTRSWQRCDASGNCQTISGANTAGYSPTASDVGYALRYADTATNNDGTITVVSSPTPVVTSPAALSASNPAAGDGNTTAGAAPPLIALPPGVVRLDPKLIKLQRGIKRTYTHSAVTLTGTLLTPDGHPLAGQLVRLLARTGLKTNGPLDTIAQTTTDTNGHWRLAAPNGPSRLIQVTYGNQATLEIAEQVTPLVQLHVSSPGSGRLVFTGALKFSPLGSPPPLVLVQAKKGRTWQTVGSPLRVSPNGKFHGAYHAPSRIIGHTFTFRAITPATAINDTGTSRATIARLR